MREHLDVFVVTRLRIEVLVERLPGKGPLREGISSVIFVI
jgi:hypothetical protein